MKKKKFSYSNLRPKIKRTEIGFLWKFEIGNWTDFGNCHSASAGFTVLVKISGNSLVLLNTNKIK